MKHSHELVETLASLDTALVQKHWSRKIYLLLNIFLMIRFYEILCPTQSRIIKCLLWIMIFWALICILF